MFSCQVNTIINDELLSKNINLLIKLHKNTNQINGLYATSNDTGGITVIEILNTHRFKLQLTNWI